MIQKINKMLVAAASMALLTASTNAQNNTINSDAPPAPPAAASPKAAPAPPHVRTLTSLRALAVTDNDTYTKDIKDLKSKEVSVQMPASKSADIYIENTQRTIIVKTWAEAKVKVTTTVYYEGDATKVSDEEWFEKLNLSVKSLGNSIRVKSGTVSTSGSYTTGNGTYNWSSGSAGVAIFNSDGDNIGTKSNVKRYVTVYIPEGNKVDVESKYSDISISNNLSKLSADITNGSLDIQDVSNFTLRSKYANVTTGNLKNAEVEFINGRFTAKDIEDLDIDTKYSTIEIASVKKATIRSTNDEYEIEEAGVIQGRKNYGNFRISKLNNSIEMDGTNADVKVRNIAATVDLIKFDNKYADIRLPLRNLKNYTVTYVGAYSSVYANFEKQPLAATNDEVIVTGKKSYSATMKEKSDYDKEKAEKEKEKAEKEKAKSDKMIDEDEVTKEVNRAVSRAFKIAEQYGGQSNNNNIDSRFTAKVGDGKGTKIDMKCQNCTVDFK